MGVNNSITNQQGTNNFVDVAVGIQNIQIELINMMQQMNRNILDIKDGLSKMSDGNDKVKESIDKMRETRLYPHLSINQNFDSISSNKKFIRERRAIQVAASER